jgi:nucleoside-diphosphate kinase
MTSGPMCALVLEGESAIEKNREIMGATNPQKAAPGTLRSLYAASMTENAVHGSDSETSAKREIGYFFPELEIF